MSYEPTPSTASENEYKFTTTTGTDIAPDLFRRCSKLFGAHYGVWGEKGLDVSPHCVPGKRAKLPPALLRAHCLSSPESTVLAACFKKDTGALVGHALASVWKYDGGAVGWVTQLVVDTAHRRRGIATHLIRTLKTHGLFHDITAIGLASSHPASIRALSKFNDDGLALAAVDTAFIARNAARIFAATPVGYLTPKDGQFLHGSLFDASCDTGAVSSVYTRFYIDHAEPLQVLEAFRRGGGWVFGELLEGHEFLIVIPVVESR